MSDRGDCGTNQASTGESHRRKLYVKTFGCQMNEYDSEKVGALLARSHDIVADPEEADTIFVNTCSVREKGEHKLFSLLGELKELKDEKPGLVIGVGGCVAQQEGAKISRRAPYVDFVVGTHNLSLIPALVEQSKFSSNPQIAVDYREEWEDLPDSFQSFEREHDGLSAVAPQAVRALVSIQRGCNKRCAFCVVPTTRGPEVSRSLEEILRETRLKVRMGAKEVLLLGQTVNSYGRDLFPRQSFANLIRQLAEISGLERIRFTSPHPADVRPDFLELYGQIPQLCPHIHLPLQSGSDRILKLMNRNYRSNRYREIVEVLRSRCPDIAITSDIIVGFPTETDADFEQTLEMMKFVRYHLAYSFKYSRRPNTVAKEFFSERDEVDPEVAQTRLQSLQKLQHEHSLERNMAMVGTIREVLIEGPNHAQEYVFRGRDPQNVLVEVFGDPITKTIPRIGELRAVKIASASPFAVRGSCVAASE